MTPRQISRAAARAVKLILSDINSRKGFSAVWSQVDRETRQEIKAALSGCVVASINAEIARGDAPDPLPGEKMVDEF